MWHRGLPALGRWAQGDRAQQQGWLLYSSDTQYKMTISMADWPSEASEVRRQKTELLFSLFGLRTSLGL